VVGETNFRELRALVQESRRELPAGSAAYAALASQVDQLDQALAAGQLDWDTIQAAYQACANYPRLQPSRGYVPVGDGFDATRKLVQEIANHRSRMELERRQP
jgi:hypothetical protein